MVRFGLFFAVNNSLFRKSAISILNFENPLSTMKHIKALFILFLFLATPLFSQEEPDTSGISGDEEVYETEGDTTSWYEEDSTSVYVIESYVRQEEKNEIVIYFFASEPVKAWVVFDGNQRFTVSDTLGESFRFVTDIQSVKATSTILKAIVYVENASGEKSSCEEFEIKLPFEPEIEGTALGYLADCTLGGISFLVPSPGFTLFRDQNRFSFFKELPLVVFQSEISTYPWMAFSVEYAHTPDIDFRNRFFAGLKFPVEVPVINYIAPGLSYSTNFLGVNGLSPEISFGLIEVFRVINLNIKARYNWYPSAGNNDNFDFNIGLTSYFLTLAF